MPNQVLTLDRSNLVLKQQLKKQLLVVFFKNTNYKEGKEKACPHVARVALVFSVVVVVVVVVRNNIQM
jgi:hypothetical protein